ncbi:MAG: type-F conjugative transfer system secretin TraK [Gammaproteobacteria bacterium]
MFRLVLIIILITFQCTSAEALQIKPIKDNRNVLVKVSSKEQSRIFVYHDRISVVRGIDGAYDLKKDDKQGDIYIQPSVYYQHKAFNLFITTEQGHTYNLLATPLDIPAETIELKPLSPSHLLAEHWEKNSPYSQTIINLINSMVNEENPDGYAVVNVGKVKPKKILNCLTMRLETVYRGGKLQGEIWVIKNEGKLSTYIHPRDFYQDNVLAVSVQNEKLDQGCETLLYRVVSHDE